MAVPSPDSGQTRGTSPTHLRIGLLSDGDSVRGALARIVVQLRDWGIPEPRIDEAQIVMAEALNNIVEHAYGKQPGGDIRISLWKAPKIIKVQIRDTGTAMPYGPPPGVALPELAADSPHALPEGGFGWVLIRQMTTDLRYSRTGKENRLTLRMRAV
jgi:serine/threonine-protein kinase RsbW